MCLRGYKTIWKIDFFPFVLGTGAKSPHTSQANVGFWFGGLYFIFVT